MTMSRVRAKIGLAAVLGLSMLPLATSVAAASPLAPAEPVVTVSPATGLSDGQSVTVTASGFAANTTLTISECTPAANNSGACKEVPPLTFSTDASGSGSTTYTVKKNFDSALPDGTPAGSVDCGTAVCFIGVRDSQAQSGGQQVFFS
ncbi:enediyne antibiotic chromoprotein [Amycolatopsis sp. QT-25]|uniref:enediyne antibiotic chromoprotein n=1 Tax=Amycolatopsis sp. QT-25 TaxID=3034022 RepID=UPI0023EB8C08|nr:enediyne antibiotic chromoprotein [Amycolatopsis sp. QT-25]WET76184.1 enediyne antibiotic chromoprotein [Amycolatopsis sp. QT-25]